MTLRLQTILLLLLICLLVMHRSLAQEVKKEKERPNIILILADDMGYGDPQCYNPKSKVPTPNINQLAKEGVMFNDAHTNSSVCTPTRYGILTGQYSWRSALKEGVTWSYDTLIINKKTSTIASMLKKVGYRTSIIGKWHLGLDWQGEGDSVQFDQSLDRGPLDIGFDYFYGISASLDIPPYVYLENNRVVEQPTGFTEGTTKTYHDDFWRYGPVSPDFDHYQVLDHLTEKAEKTITKYAQNQQPFFVYFPLTAPHLPWIPKESFQGKSGAGNYGDLSMEVDHVVGRINNLVKELGIEKETMIIFTSDNGSQFSSENMNNYQHKANGNYRGRKGDIYEGGHRVPFIVKWHGKVKAGKESSQIVSTTDFYATFADLTGQFMPEYELKDSYSFLPELLEIAEEHQAMRNVMVYHSAKGMFGLRDKNLVFVKGKGSGGFLELMDTTNISAPFQLYNLLSDPLQKENLYPKDISKATSLAKNLEAIINKTID